MLYSQDLRELRLYFIDLNQTQMGHYFYGIKDYPGPVQQRQPVNGGREFQLCSHRAIVSAPASSTW